jgi:hypothetical protein
MRWVACPGYPGMFSWEPAPSTFTVPRPLSESLMTVHQLLFTFPPDVMFIVPVPPAAPKRTSPEFAVALRVRTAPPETFTVPVPTLPIRKMLGELCVKVAPLVTWRVP